MSKNTRNILIVVVIIAIIGAGAVYWYISRPVAEASQDVADTTQQLETAADDSTSEAVFRISQDDSTVQFAIDEVLRGSDFTAVGTTSEVGGDILVNFTEPSASQVGQIRVNARTLKTDSSNRDGAIARFILMSEADENEFIEFNPTSVSGLPTNIEIGETAEIEVTGDLTITGTTAEATFTGTVTLDSEDQISGSLEATVLRSTYGLTIPSVPFVAEVDDEVILTINFVANRVADES